MHMTLATRIRAADGAPTPVGVEFMTPSVTSVNVREKIAEWVEETVRRATEPILRRAANGGELGATKRIGDECGRVANRVACEVLQRGLDYAVTDGASWGYSVVSFSRDACTWDVYSVDKTVPAPEADCEPAYRVRLPAGRYVLQERHEEVPGPEAARSNDE